MGVSIYFGFGLLCFLAFGVSYLYMPMNNPDLSGAVAVSQCFIALVSGMVSGFATIDGSHLKVKS